MTNDIGPDTQQKTHEMNPQDADQDRSRFDGARRAHHQRATNSRPTWEQWVDPGGTARPFDFPKLLRFSGFVIGILVFIAIIIALFIEMR
jgi:hypothetical protein